MSTTTNDDLARMIKVGFDGVTKQINGLQGQVNGLQGQINEIRQDINQLEMGQNRIELRLDEKANRFEVEELRDLIIADSAVQ